jgi:hypothetical protein
MAELFPVPEVEDLADEFKLQIPEGVNYTLLHDDRFGIIPSFSGSKEKTEDLNELARQGRFEIPTKPRQ